MSKAHKCAKISLQINSRPNPLESLRIWSKNSLQGKEPFVRVLVASHNRKRLWVVFGPSPGGGLFVYLLG
ncbi:hypothetical protein A2456_02215 [Candidatus Nomurabacteria bacterium RIFOXYC2_FULL_36_19]|uniref:Uncharacterized protein n=1 Tax=Candidatus Nomurabacteria bacterium RIFOXYC2_FULL_36_19 TaxID=1801806 RepID=A0A1F6YWT2_9BACT|nr:MAG: hypothetical protein A2456_02215 [Candidatus Nomurabacteria bacterium RIFOXYC2_FULL_36_19]